MIRVVSPNDMKAWDRACIADGIPSKTLMLRAAEGLEYAISERFRDRPVTAICGSGNNGGDGIALACLLHRRGIPTQIVLAGNPEKLTDDATYYLKSAEKTGVLIRREWEPIAGELLVDALFGVGLDRPVKGSYSDLIERMNASQSPILSVDIPSGLDARTGCVLGTAVRATETVTMQYIKSGLLLGKGRVCSGRITVCPLVEERPFPFSEEQFWQQPEDVAPLLPPRPIDSHKGKNGHALLCVGSDRYVGAALLSAKAALRAGCGILSVCTPDSVRRAFSALPEAITVPMHAEEWDVRACQTAAGALPGKRAVGIGCGIGDADVSPLLERILNAGIPAVIDADGLNCLSRNRSLFRLLHKNVILTPHPGEMARLLDCSTESVLNDPLAARGAFPCTVLLKGATTIIFHCERAVFCTEGTPGLSKGGSGDVLTGIITGLLSQGLSPFDAARAGTALLGMSAKEAYRLLGERMLLASDVTEAMGAIWNEK